MTLADWQKDLGALVEYAEANRTSIEDIRAQIAGSLPSPETNPKRVRKSASLAFWGTEPCG